MLHSGQISSWKHKIYPSLIYIIACVFCDTNTYNIFDNNIHCVIKKSVSKSEFLEVASIFFKFDKIVIHSNHKPYNFFEPDPTEYLDDKNRKRILVIHIFINDYQLYNIGLKNCLKLRELIVLPNQSNVVLNTEDIYEFKQLQSFSVKYISLGYNFINILRKSKSLKKFNYIWNYMQIKDNLKPLLIESSSFNNKINELHLELNHTDNMDWIIQPLIENIDKYTNIKKMGIIIPKITSYLFQILSEKIPKLIKLKSMSIQIYKIENPITLPLLKKIEKISSLSLFNDNIYTDISGFFNIRDIQKLKINNIFNISNFQAQSGKKEAKLKIVELCHS